MSAGVCPKDVGGMPFGGRRYSQWVQGVSAIGAGSTLIGAGGISNG